MHMVVKGLKIHLKYKIRYRHYTSTSRTIRNKLHQVNITISCILLSPLPLSLYTLMFFGYRNDRIYLILFWTIYYQKLFYRCFTFILFYKIIYILYHTTHSFFGAIKICSLHFADIVLAIIKHLRISGRKDTTCKCSWRLSIYRKTAFNFVIVRI